MMNSVRAHKLNGISEMKFLLILGVVMIHCNLANDYGPETVASNPGLELVRWISTMVCQGCVPCFFMLSAYLMFNGVKKFAPQIYAEKLRRRVHTLLVPYLLWCTLCAAGIFVEHEFLNKSGLGVFLDNGGIDLHNFIKGYWAVAAKQNMPFAFAFWFIRNLMVFVVLSPLARMLASRWWLVALLFAFRIFSGMSLGGFEWYVAGTFAATSGILTKLRPMRQPGSTLVATGLFIVCSATLYYCNGVAYRAVATVQTIATMVVAIAAAKIIERAAKRRQAVATLVSATFMIYAIHQCISTSTRHLWEGIFGVETIGAALAAYACALLTMVAVSVAIYLPMRRFTPGVLSVLTGGR